MSGSQIINVSSYKIIVGSTKNITKPYTMVAIWIVKDGIMFDVKYGSFTLNILKIQ